MVRILSVGLLAWLLAGPALASDLDPRASTLSAMFSAGSASRGCSQMLTSTRCGAKCIRCTATCAQSGSGAVTLSPALAFPPHQEMSPAPAPRFADETRAPDTDPPKRSVA